MDSLLQKIFISRSQCMPSLVLGTGEAVMNRYSPCSPECGDSLSFDVQYLSPPSESLSVVSDSLWPHWPKTSKIRLLNSPTYCSCSYTHFTHSLNCRAHCSKQGPVFSQFPPSENHHHLSPSATNSAKAQFKSHGFLYADISQPKRTLFLLWTPKGLTTMMILTTLSCALRSLCHTWLNAFTLRVGFTRVQPCLVLGVRLHCQPSWNP